MNKQSSLRPSESLVERAAQVYDLESFFTGGRQAETAPAPKPVEPQPPVDDDDRTLALDDTMIWPSAPAPAEAAPQPKPRRTDAPGAAAVLDRAALEAAGFLVPDAAVSTLAEEFRIIKRQLLGGVKTGAKGQTILVCSAQPDEGKTFCAINLALSMAAEKDLEVVLIDGDFAKHEIPTLLGLDDGPGFLDAVADPRLDVERLVVRTDIGGLSILPAGRRSNDVTELLSSARTAEVLAALVDGRPGRVVIFDSPPTLVASPATVLASHAGQVMMVVRADRTTDSELREALSLLSACENIQLMLNGTSLATSGRRFGSYYGYGE